jgi:hypothetical protein
MKPSVSVCMKPMYRDIGHTISAGENELIAAWFNQQRAILLAIQRQPAGLWNLDLKHASDRFQDKRSCIPKLRGWNRKRILPSWSVPMMVGGLPDFAPHLGMSSCWPTR